MINFQLRIWIIYVAPTFDTSNFFLLRLNGEQLLNDQLPVANLHINLAESSLSNVCNSSFFIIAEHPKRSLSNIEITDYKSFKAIRIRSSGYISPYVSQIKILCASAALLLKTKQKTVANKLFIWLPL